MAIGWHFVINQRGVIIKGNFSTKSLIISNEALPDPTIIPAFNVVSAKLESDKIDSTFFLDDKCFDSSLALLIPLKYITCWALVCSILFLKLLAQISSIFSKSPVCVDIE